MPLVIWWNCRRVCPLIVVVREWVAVFLALAVSSFFGRSEMKKYSVKNGKIIVDDVGNIVCEEDAFGARLMLEVVAVNVERRLAVLSNGAHVPVTNLIDGHGDEADEAVSFVAGPGPDGEWWACKFGDFSGKMDG